MGVPVCVGVDLGKTVLQVHAVDAEGRVVEARALSRAEFRAWCARLPAGCCVAMESCGSAHYWGRQLGTMGLAVRLLPPSFVVPYRLNPAAKNDGVDAEAVCEAASRPRMRFVSVKSAERQGVLALHRLRDGYVEERIACINRLRGLLAEFGEVLPRTPRAFAAGVSAAVEDRRNDLCRPVRVALRRALRHLARVEKEIAWFDCRILAGVRRDATARSAMTICGVGPLTASAVLATIGDGLQFRNGRQFSSWLGLVPAQRSTGGRAALGHITKHGNSYLRRLLVLGARSALTTAHRRDDPVARWAVQLRQRAGWGKASVALANKNARMLWATVSKSARGTPAVPRGQGA